MNRNATKQKSPSLTPGGGQSSGAAAFFSAAWKRIRDFFTGAGSLEKRKSRAGWVFIMPFVIGLAFIYIPVVINSIVYSFCEIKPSRLGTGSVLVPVGWSNYAKALFEDTDFVQTLFSGIQQLIIDIPAIVIFSLFVAVILNQKMFGRAAFRAIFFIPVILSTGLIDSIDVNNTMFDHMNNSSGIDDGSGTNAASQIVNAVDVERLFASMKVGTEIVEYVTGIVNDIYNIVNRSGVQILIFLAGLQSISPSIYEACTIDGATAWETFWKITFPMISPMILVNALYTIIDSFTSASNTVMSYINSIYNNSKTELATAMAWIYFVIIMAIIAIFFAVASAYIFYQKRDA